MSNFKMFETRGYGEPVSTYSDLEKKDVVNILDVRADLTVEEKQTVLTFLDTASYGEFCQVQGWYILCLKQDYPLMPGLEFLHCMREDGQPLPYIVRTAEGVDIARGTDEATAWRMARIVVGQMEEDFRTAIEEGIRIAVSHYVPEAFANEIINHIGLEGKDSLEIADAIEAEYIVGRPLYG